MIKIKSEEHIYKKYFVKQLIMIFHKHNMKKHDVDHFNLAWFIEYADWLKYKSLDVVCIAYIVIFLDQTLKIK